MVLANPIHMPCTSALPLIRRKAQASKTAGLSAIAFCRLNGIIQIPKRKQAK